MSNQISKEQRVLNCLNSLIRLKNISYGDINKVVPFEGKLKFQLRGLQHHYPELGIIACPTLKEEGVSSLSLLSTVTEILIGKSLALMIDTNPELITPTFERPIKHVDWIDQTEIITTH